MSVAVDLDLPAVDARSLGTVTVRYLGLARSHADCSCGWTGKLRLLKAAAEQDAWMHSIHERCQVAVPLVRPAVAR
ncbi:hypothetical protein H7J88_05055 [Mycolicibacterium flavescens]|uniref:Uncharacterized protein n=1 Tax=Mycolicibacterium flavescens TaxID=1776 RepID=A0A1E3RKV0_MYCFV|nr:hypothetical protein [Mycolicibacterium flavescens]MCV7279012.1 hypothetical protein [Mycolicibacterium flavescens]ODQ90505.1 hypothetical protein BHQ18_10750 [Mycolicibacterium flavescens]